MELATKPNVDQEEKLNFFLSQAAIKKDQARLKIKIKNHVNASQAANYVLFRHSSLYFFSAEQVATIEQTHDKYKGSDYLRFDGHKVTKINPEFYLGPASLQRRKTSSEGVQFEFESEWDGNSNNNNNNNNNGNNGNNG